MSGAGDAGDALRRVSTLAEETNHPLLDEIEGETDDGREVYGYLIEHGNHQLTAVSVEGDEHFEIKYSYDIRADILRIIAGRQAPGEEDVEITDELMATTDSELRGIISHKDDQEIQNLLLRLIESLSTGDCSYQIHNEHGAPHGVTMTAKVFPNHDLTHGKFDRACQSVVSYGLLGKHILSLAYNLPTDAPAESRSDHEARPEAEGSRGFQ